MTAITSALRIVVNLCAMMIVVRLCSCSKLSRASWTTLSDSESSADVASSRIRTLGFAMSTRAIAIRCFCPPETAEPLSPTWVSYPSGKAEIKS
mmetsp:Transcript_12620/g.29946  ORF Transcript_12620/g.29946 Transcript_12620/m.29946 type:complete len:94 (-) Transcript_12620:564-845(-)